MEPVKTYRIFLAAICACISLFAVGVSMGWTSPVLPKLKNQTVDSPLSDPPSLNEEAWILSTLSMTAAISPFLGGPLSDYIGRKWVLLSSSIFFGVSSVAMMNGNKVWIIILGRFFQGIGVGFVMTVTPMYIGEISTDNSRGATSSLMQLFVSGGILYVYIVGPYVSYFTLQWYCLAIPVVFDIAFLFIPESPFYYVGKGRREDSITSLKFLRGQSASAVNDEMVKIQTQVQQSMANKGTIIDVFRVPSNRKALFISSGLIVFQSLSGIDVVLFNSQSIFIQANTGIDPPKAAIIIAFVQFASSFLTPFIVERLGRKIILLMSAAGMAAGLFALGWFFYVQSKGGELDGILWMPVTALILFFIMFSVGFGPLPWALIGEIFPSNIKSFASSIVISITWIMSFLTNYFYPPLNSIGGHYVFWLYAIFSSLGFLFVFFVVFETEGLSFQEIQDRLRQ